jgi:hypothetical protein
MAILSVGSEVGAGDEVRLRLPSVGIMMGASGSVTVGLYDTLRAASSGENSLKMRMANDVVMIASGLMETGTPYDEPYPTAEVSKEFKEFIEAGPHTDIKGTIGSYVVGWMEGLLARDGSAVDDLGNLVIVADSDVMIAGDFSVGTFHLDDMMDCTTETGQTGHAAVAVNEDKDMGTAELSEVEQTASDMDGKYLCITVDGETEIPAGSYHASVKYAKLADAVMDAMGGSELVGEIRRNGTTIHIPYLTTSDRYNQRLVIVNRGPIDAEYSMTFRPEMNVMAAGGGGHTGTVDAGETKVLVLHPMRAAQVGQDPVVMITGGSRTAATLNVVADANDIDVATVTITLETGASDTVQYFEETVHARD